jgi:cobyrinic acid a,c-diamide synthase
MSSASRVMSADFSGGTGEQVEMIDARRDARSRGKGLIIAAPASGSGKTLVTTGLLRHFFRTGVDVAAAKAGPDFIDPTLHHDAGGSACFNLDVWAMRRATLAALVAELEATADLVLCEGVMGLFDGTGADGETGSTAELARLTGWPVVLVVDAHGQGASVAALLRGFAAHDPAASPVGVIFNRVSSVRHQTLLAQAVARHMPDLACLGALPADPGLTLPSRHLGLVPAGELAETEAIIERAAAMIEAAVDIGRLEELARASLLGGSPRPRGIPPLGRRIAVARDEAFRFAYPALLQGWRREGAELAFFSPLANEPPDPTADAIYLPGGYPELWAGRLAAATIFASGLRRAASQGKPIYGECGGYMVLGECLTDADGHSHRMPGLLPLSTSFAERQLHLGYRCATLLESTPLGSVGARFHGHEFHYATIASESRAVNPLLSVIDAAGEELGTCGLRRGSVFGSFIHLVDCRGAA